MTVASAIVGQALVCSGIAGVGQTPLAQDIGTGSILLNQMVAAWQTERLVTGTPGALPPFPDQTTDVTFWYQYEGALLWGLVARLRAAYELPPNDAQIKLAATHAALLQANNKQFQPSIAGSNTDQTGNGLVLLALRAAGRITDQQGASLGSQDVADGLILLNEMYDEWNRERAITVTPGGFAGLANGSMPIAMATGQASATVWNLAVRIRSAFGLEDNQQQIAQAAKSLALLQANNKQFQTAPAAAGTDQNGNGIVMLALRAAGRITDQQSAAPGSQDATDGLLLLNEMYDEWNRERTVTVTPGFLAKLADGAALLNLPAGQASASVWNLAVRIRSAFGLDENKQQIVQAAKSLALLQANNRQQQPAVHPGVPATAIQIIFQALRMAGRITDTQNVSDDSQDVSDAFNLLVSMVAQWSRERWLVFDLTDTIAVATGRRTYSIGAGGDFNIARPDRIESAFVRLVPGGFGTGAIALPAPVTINAQIASSAVLGEFSPVDFDAEFNIGSSAAYSTFSASNAFSATDYDNEFAGVQASSIASGTGYFASGEYDAEFALTPAVQSSVPAIQAAPAILFSRFDFSNDFDIGFADTYAVDYPLDILDSREDYNLIGLKGLSSFPTALFYDSAYPRGTIYLYPTPPAGQFEIHLSVKGTLPVYASVNDPLGLPPEYNEALYSNLACRIMAWNGGQPTAYMRTLASKSLRVIRGANAQVPRLQMPFGLPTQGMRRGGGWGFGGIAYPVGASNQPLPVPTTAPLDAFVLDRNVLQ